MESLKERMAKAFDDRNTTNKEFSTLADEFLQLDEEQQEEIRFELEMNESKYSFTTFAAIVASNAAIIAGAAFTFFGFLEKTSDVKLILSIAAVLVLYVPFMRIVNAVCDLFLNTNVDVQKDRIKKFWDAVDRRKKNQATLLDLADQLDSEKTTAK